MRAPSDDRRRTSRTPMSGRASLVVPLTVACLGGILLVLGLAILGGDVSRWMDARGWHSDSLLDFIQLSSVEAVLPDDLVIWLRHPRLLIFLHEAVVFVLDHVTQWAACLVLGGFIVWKALK